MKNRKFVYAFKNCHGATSIVNYDGDNRKVNSFIQNFDAWGSLGERKRSADGEHISVWFEALPEMLGMLNTLPFKAAFERMGVKLVFEYPFCKYKSEDGICIKGVSSTGKCEGHCSYFTR